LNSVPSGASPEVLLNVERGQISLTKLFEVVVEDLLILNQNLKSLIELPKYITKDCSTCTSSASEIPCTHFSQVGTAQVY
ncbi:hypothetical protein LINPERHAP2_LOCUS33462, partial [Linum perenne]